MGRHDPRFALTDTAGRLIALVADGLTPWPADLAAVADADLRTLEQEYLAEFNRLATDPNADVAVLTELAEHVAGLRNEAARRMAAAPPAPTEPTAEELAARQAQIDALRDGLAAGPAINDDGTHAPFAGTHNHDHTDGNGDSHAHDHSHDDDASHAHDHSDMHSHDHGPGIDLAAFGTAVATATATAVTAALAERLPAVPHREPAPVSAADIGRFRTPGRVGIIPEIPRQRVQGRLVATVDVPDYQVGQEFADIHALARAMGRRWENIGRTTGVDEERIPVAKLALDFPDERNLTGLIKGGEIIDFRAVRDKVLAVCGPDAVGINPWTGKEALIASGGLAAPVEPYYPQLVLSESARPVQDALPTFVAERGGIKLVQPPTLGSITGVLRTGEFLDGVGAGSTTFTSATAAFTAADIGSPIVQLASSGGTGVVTTNIPAGTVITAVGSGTSVTVSNTVSSATGIIFYLSKRNPNNLGMPVNVVTASQDAAGPPNIVKFTFDVPLGIQNEYDVYSVYTSLQFANLTARTFPEQVEAYIRLAAALHARIAEQTMLDTLTNYSTLFTGAKTFGTARQLLAQWGHMAAYYRNHNRMDPAAVLRILVPAWAVDAMRADYLSTFIGGGAANWGLSDDEIAGFFQGHGLMPTLYWDGPSDISQLFASPGSGAINTGSNSATPIAIPDYPGVGSGTTFRTNVISYMWGEGTWLGLTTGELNLGLVRDSILNSQNRFRQFSEVWETPAFVGFETLRCVHTTASDGTYGAAVSVTLQAGSGL